MTFGAVLPAGATAAQQPAQAQPASPQPEASPTPPASPQTTPPSQNPPGQPPEGAPANAPPVRVFNATDNPGSAPGSPSGSASQTSNAPAPTTSPATGFHAPVELIKSTPPKAATLAGRKSSYSFKVGTEDWLNTGVTVAPGDQLSFSADGTLTLPEARTTGPEGIARGWRDLIRGFPLNSANSGALIGRVGNADAAVPFEIGAKKDVDVTTAGTLYLRANLSSDLTATGDYKVTMKLGKPAAGATAAPAARVPDLTRTVSPALFQNIPRQVQDQAGAPGDMVNFALIGTEDQVKKAFAASGWVAVDKTTQDAIVHGLIATLAHEAYTQVPVSTLFLFGRSQDLSFERAAPVEVAAIRHHLRVWKSGEMVEGKPLWVGSATHDNGFEKDQRNGSVTHHIDPNIDEERDFLEHSFADAGQVAAAAYVLPPSPLTTAHTATGGDFHSDGRIVLMDLR